MVVLPNERVPIARLLKFLELGERLAHDCARAQAALAPDGRARRFLLSQSRQEAHHALVFQAAAAWLAPRHLGESPLLPPLQQYRRLVEDTLRAEDWHQTLLAEQIILEGLGEALLHRMEEGLEKRQAPFLRLRRVLLRQEEAHHGFGRRMLGQAIEDGRTSTEELRAKAPAYLSLAGEMVAAVAELLDAIDEDAAAWAADMDKYLPEWLRPEAR
jgi:hypothetical protein